MTGIIVMGALSQRLNFLITLSTVIKMLRVLTLKYIIYKGVRMSSVMIQWVAKLLETVKKVRILDVLV